MPLSDVLTDSEVSRRISVLKRLRELLFEQRNRFQTYLETLESQKAVIDEGNIDAITAHVDLEEQILADILSIEKSLKPMRELYVSVWKDADPPDIKEVNETLANLKIETARRANENKILIQKKLGSLSAELKTLRANPFQRARLSVQAEAARANFLDVNG